MYWYLSVLDLDYSKAPLISGMADHLQRCIRTNGAMSERYTIKVCVGQGSRLRGNWKSEISDLTATRYLESVGITRQTR